MKTATIKLSSLFALLLSVAACSSGGGDSSSAGGGPAFVTTTLPDGVRDEAYLAPITVVGGVGTHSWAVVGGSLPPGVALDDTATGPGSSLAGTPTVAGSYSFSVGVATAAGTAVQTFTLDVMAGATLVNGWTEFEEQPGALVVHVSETGNDSNDGSELSPKRTLAAGFAMLRNGQADWLLLKRGDSFQLNSTFQWNKSGPASGNGWMRLGAYGDEGLPRPVLLSQGGYIVVTPGYQSSATITRLAFTDIFLLAADRIANSATTTQNINGVHFIATQWQGTGVPFSHFLMENCRISGFTFGLICEDNTNDVKVRRCIFDHIFVAGGAHSSGILCGAQTFLLEDSVIYKVMSPDIPGLGSNAYSQFAHAAYIGSNATNVTTRGNIVIKAPEGIMQRAGGSFTRNVCVQTNNGTNIGQAWGVTPAPGGVQAVVEENLILNTITHLVHMGNTASGSVRSNMLLQDQDGNGQTDLSLVPINNAGSGVNVGVHNTTFADNLLSGSITWNSGDTASFSGLVFTGNQQNLGPTTTSIAAYLQAVGWSGSTLDDWANHLLQRDRRNYSVVYESKSVIDFYRAHYALPPLD
ncbi:MAG: hypothetical protein KDC48_10100 [Planctomycetes bacterium]|nr:hypothetical protein [Planctomycetota bacterium]